MPWRPSEPGEVPTLGYIVLDWITEYLAAPDRGEYEPFVPYREQAEFILRFYEINPVTGKRRYARGLLGRPRGWGKSPLLAALACAEALGPVVPEGWDAAGQPVGIPWSDLRTPLVHIAAVSETQTKNTWTPLLEMLEGPNLYGQYPGLEPLDTFVNLPRGRIEQVTSSARTVKGARALFAVLDQTEEWVPGNGGPKLAQKMRVNAAKVGGATIESPNAYTPGEGSVAEQSAKYASDIMAGTALDDSLLYDHREAPPETEMFERKSITAGLRVSYGDSSAHPDGCVIHQPACPPGHVDLDRLITEIWSSTQEPEESRTDFLNQIVHAADSWLSQTEIKAVTDVTKVVADRDVITLGFDGSRGRAKGKPDATALMGCRVSDGHLFEIKVWEAPNQKELWDKWSPPLPEIEAAVGMAFQRYAVAAFYADPAKDWRSYVNGWEAKYANQLVRGLGGNRVTATRDHPFEWWMTGGRSGLIQRAIEQLEGAIRNGDMSFDGSFDTTRHMLNARRRFSAGKMTLRKPHDYSSDKIDAAVAAVLAWQARIDAVAAGIGQVARVIPQRLR